MSSFRSLTVFLLASLAVLSTPVTGAAADKMHRLALQISDSDAEKMTAVLNVAVNVTKYYEQKGEEVEIRVVAFNAGLHMLRDDTSPVKERIAGFAKSMPGVTFNACGNTIDGMARKEGKKPPILASATVVPAGVITLMELASNGWTIIRP